MFDPRISLVEVVVRTMLVYLGLMLIVRLSGKRQVGELGPMDLLTMLILSETVSPALTNQDPSILAGWTAAATLMAITFAVDWATHRWKRLERVVEGSADVLIRDGVVDRAVQDRLRLSDDEVGAALREEGLDDPRDVRLAVVETTGRVSVVPKERV